MASDLMKAMFADTQRLEPKLETADVPSLSQVCPKPVSREIVEKLLRMAASPTDAQSLMKVAGQTNRTRFRTVLLKPLIAAGLLESTIPDKPRSSKQKYRLTDKGRQVLRAKDR